MAKNKVGLHKEIKSIFDGVPIPKDNGDHKPVTTLPPYQTGYPAQNLPAGSGQMQFSAMPPPRQVSQPIYNVVSPEQSKNNVVTVAETNWQRRGKQIWQQIKEKFLKAKSGATPARQKIMVILVPGLFITLVIIFTQVLGSPSTKKAHAKRPEPSKVSVASNNKINWQIPDPYPTTLRDPMKPSSAVANADGTGQGQDGNAAIIIKGIGYSADNPTALIGTTIVHEGDMISGAKVLKINKDNVEFQMDNKKWTQQVQP